MPEKTDVLMTVSKATAKKCERCWNYREAVGSRCDASDALRPLRGGSAVMRRLPLSASGADRCHCHRRRSSHEIFDHAVDATA